MSTAIQSAASSVLGSSLSNSSSTTNSLFGATSGSSSSSSNSSASSSLDALSQQVAAMDLAAQQNNIKTQDYEKDTNDVQIDNRMTARNVGILRQNYSRLNVFSSLDKNDPADFFTFTASTSGPTKLGVLTDNSSENTDVRFQVIDKSGNTIADSSPDAGAAYDAFQQLQAGTFNLQSGKYVLRVTRQDDSKANQQNAYNYAIQLSQGLYKNDYDVVEKGVDKTADPYGLAANSSLDTLTSSLAGAVSDLQNLPPIGTSATDKLTGVLSSLTA